MTQKKKNVFSRKITDYISPFGLLKKGTYSITDCFPDDQKFTSQVESIKAELKVVQGLCAPLVELMAQADSTTPFERVIAYYLILMSDIVNPKGMKLICLVIYTSMTLDTEVYTTNESDESEEDAYDEDGKEEMQTKTKKNRLDYIADMANDIYTQVIDCHKSTKLSVVYIIKSLCTFLFKFDFSSQTVNLNRQTSTPNLACK
jgi:hypothetical protein